MAYWYRSKKTGKVYVVTRQNGKDTQYPKKNYTFLDGYTDPQIDDWVANWAEQWEEKNVHSDSILFQNDKLTDLLKKWTAYRISRGVGKRTTDNHYRLLEEEVIPFFLQFNPPKKKLSEWPGVTIKMLAYFQQKGLKPSAIRQANIALRQWWLWLEEEGEVGRGLAIKLRDLPGSSRQKTTPLKSVITPDQVWNWIDNCKREDMQMIALLAYFFSLRPYEVMGAKRSDFLAGKATEALEAAKSMQPYGAFFKLAFNVQRARDLGGVEVPVKTAASLGWVCCTDERAAKLTVQLLNRAPKEGWLFPTPHTPDWYLKQWSQEKLGYPNTVPKDMRRASIYHLGHYVIDNPLVLQKHARHTGLNTTMLYCRRPGEVMESNDDELSLD